jgi:ABC-2 type transport system ATP-binding protein
VRELIGVQLQTAEYFPELTLLELVELFASFYKKSASPTSLLDQVGLKSKMHNKVSQLSGGQKQRFSIALALVNQPKLLFLDEPSTGLDPKTRRDLWGLIKEINEKGTTIVLTTHYMEEAELLCDRVAIMDKGKILKIDHPERLISDVRNTTQVSFFTTKEIEENSLSSLPGVSKVYSSYPKTILEITSLDVVASLFDELKKTGIKPSGFTLKTASLEDVYLDLTGKEYIS